MPENFVQMVSDLGGTLGSLIACFWYIKYQQELQEDPNCKLFRLGFTQAEVESALTV